MLNWTKNKIIEQSKSGIGILLFIICAIAIYYQVGKNENLNTYGTEIKNQLKQVSIFSMFVLLILMFLNLWIESIKWKTVLNSENQISVGSALKSIFVGQAFAFYTPNRVGEYAGRTLMLISGNKVMAVGRMAWSNYAQLIVTIVAGSFAVFVHPPILSWLRWVTPILMIIALMIYFHQRPFIGWFKIFNFLQIETSLKVRLLFLSLLRYSVFLLQYCWVLHILNIPIPYVEYIIGVAVMFLCLSVLPTISLTELVIRGQLVLLIMAPWYHNGLMLITLSTLIWLVNFLLPAIIGAFLLLGFKLNR